MRIGIDGRLVLHKLRGIGGYIYNVLNEVLKIDSENSYYLYVNGSSPYNIAPVKNSEIISALSSYKNLKVVSVDSKYEFLWEQVLLPLQAKSDRIDLLHMTANRMPLFTHCKSIVTVHDMIEILFFDKMYRNLSGFRGRFYDWRVGCYIKFLYSHVFKRADCVVTVSDYSRNDIIKLAGVAPKKITVIHNGFNHEFSHRNLPRENFIFAFGNGAQHKNCPAIIKAYSTLSEGLKNKYQLVIAGRIPELEQLSRDLHEKNVVFKDFLPKEKLIQMYNQASCFLFLSGYEGFGIPLLEAMSCGAPVVASDKSSIPEIVGDAGLLVDPSNTKMIAQAIEKVLTDTGVSQKMAEKGFERAKQFSWEISARKHLELYKSI